LCGSRKYPYSPHRRDWNFLRGGGLNETKNNLKKSMKLYWNFLRGGEVFEKIPFIRELWILSGTKPHIFQWKCCIYLPVRKFVDDLREF